MLSVLVYKAPKFITYLYTNVMGTFKTRCNTHPIGQRIILGYIYTNIQICHASGGNMMECFPEGGWFSLGLRPRGNIPSCYPHWHGIFVLSY